MAVKVTDSGAKSECHDHPLARQVATAFGKRIDLVAIDADGDLLAVELKRGRTPRDVVAQVLDYGSWLKSLTYADVKRIFEDAHRDGPSFESAFATRFGDAPPELLNEQHDLVIIATDFDPGTERIVQYLATERIDKQPEAQDRVDD